MLQKIELIKLINIAADNKFNFNRCLNLDQLKDSLDSVGFIYPLIGWRYNTSILLIDGFKRFHLAKTWSLAELPFILLPHEYSMLDVIKFRYYNIKHENSELNALQKVSIYSLLKTTKLSKIKLDEWIRKLNLIHEEKLLGLMNWPKVAKKYIYDYNVSLKQVRCFINHDSKTVQEIFSIGVSLNIRIVELTKIYELVSEIALNEDTTIISVLNKKSIAAILNNKHINRNQKIVQLKKILYEWRYPIISKYQHELANLLKTLSFKNNTHISFDNSFEKPEIVLSVKLQNEKDLRDLISTISNKTNIESLEKMLNLI